MWLRSKQAYYLEYLAERDDVSLSAALSLLIRERLAVAPQEEASSPAAKKRTLRLSFEQDELRYIENLSKKLGINRSEIVRRLIDEAVTRDRTL